MNCGAQLQLGIRREAAEVERIAPFDRNKLYAAPPMAPVEQEQAPATGFVPAALVPVQQQNEETEKDYGSQGDYDSSGRSFAILLSVSALAITLVALFALPLDFDSFDNTLLRVAMIDGETTVMALVIVTLVVGLVSLIMPMFNVVTGALLIVSSYMAYNDLVDKFLQLSSPGFIVYVLLAVYVIVLGVVSTIFMKRFINHNINGVPVFRACYLTWTGIPHN